MVPSLDPAAVVLGSAKLTERFGGWPSFHDSEVVSLRFERSGRDGFEGPVLFLVLHLFRGIADTASASGVTWVDHTLVTFRFGGVLEAELLGFNHQNALDSLVLEAAGALPGSALEGYRVRLESSFGLAARFLCASIEVESALPGIPEGSVYAPSGPSRG